MGVSRTRSEYLNKTWIIQNGWGYPGPAHRFPDSALGRQPFVPAADPPV
jgi:hypothetical protein